MSKKAKPSWTKGLALRSVRPPKADDSTLRSARSIFGDGHAAENDRNLFRGCGRETLRGF